MSGVRTIFDVGANVGEWCLMCARICPNATIHAFEILPSTYRRLITNISGCQRIVPHDFGLSDTSGETVALARDGNSDLTSLVRDVPLMYGGGFVETPVSTCTGDAFCADNGIADIDLLKIDAEGFDFAVLSGFKNLIERRKIRVIQFEYGLPNVLARTLVRDFYDLLLPFGYHLGKLYPDRVDFREWRPLDEQFGGPNLVATTEPDLFV